MPTLNWIGQRARPASPLYLSYDNMAEVMHYGKLVGRVFALPTGYYRPSIDGIRGDDCATPDSAARKVVELWEQFRR